VVNAHLRNSAGSLNCSGDLGLRHRAALTSAGEDSLKQSRYWTLVFADGMTDDYDARVSRRRPTGCCPAVHAVNSLQLMQLSMLMDYRE
jgi:hypothetical protein